ncbi:TRAPP subunit TRS23 Ecym_1402 [Eremothecium cymbalariae DBVPG|uniref:Trafficking protein particle complex subunit n=1 Tax=Eremothecium cymbalariae (strain CBS 270.75 / DBVPG 7215 / KCTC 17166 / NRRL Y-17582) TaxID=931890 RepID=G8JM60_ERECY|nr:hypothetical protein Ecym_1402 [Eremothecium cymbalariae DBVPG\
MAIKSLLIINKSGGLVYQRDFIPSPHGKMNSNEYLILAGTLHGVVAIASQLTPKALQVSSTQNLLPLPSQATATAANAANATNTANNGSTTALGGYGDGAGSGSGSGSAANSSPSAAAAATAVAAAAAAAPEHTVPYIPSLGMAANDSKPPGRPMGSYLAPDYFSDSFISWNKSGLKSIVTNDFSIFLYQSLTGVKFVLISTQQSTSNAALHLADNLLRKVYCLYSDYVMKNPFYSADMLIRSEPFDKKLHALVANL